MGWVEKLFSKDNKGESINEYIRGKTITYSENLDLSQYPKIEYDLKDFIIEERGGGYYPRYKGKYINDSYDDYRDNSFGRDINDSVYSVSESSYIDKINSVIEFENIGDQNIVVDISDKYPKFTIEYLQSRGRYYPRYKGKYIYYYKKYRLKSKKGYCEYSTTLNGKIETIEGYINRNKKVNEIIKII